MLQNYRIFLCYAIHLAPPKTRNMRNMRNRVSLRKFCHQTNQYKRNPVLSSWFAGERSLFWGYKKPGFYEKCLSPNQTLHRNPVSGCGFRWAIALWFHYRKPVRGLSVISGMGKPPHGGSPCEAIKDFA